MKRTGTDLSSAAVPPGNIATLRNKPFDNAMDRGIEIM